MPNPVLVSGSTDWGATGSWDTEAVPVDADGVYLRNSTANIISTLNQSAIQPAILEAERSFTGDIGTATSELQIGPVILNVGRQLGVQTTSQAGSDRIKIASGSDVCTVSCFYTATTSADTGFEPFRWRGTNASNVLNMYGGIMGVATNDPDDTATLATVNQFGGTLNLAGGCTLTTINLDGAQSLLSFRSAATTLNQSNGTVSRYGSGALTTWSMKGGSGYDYCTGTITTMTVYPGTTLFKWSAAATITTLNLYGTLDLSQATGAITLTTVNILSEDAVVLDPLGRLGSTAFVCGAGVRSFTYTGPGGETFTIA